MTTSTIDSDDTTTSTENVWHQPKTLENLCLIVYEAIKTPPSIESHTNKRQQVSTPNTIWHHPSSPDNTNHQLRWPDTISQNYLATYKDTWKLVQNIKNSYQNTTQFSITFQHASTSVNTEHYVSSYNITWQHQPSTQMIKQSQQEMYDTSQKHLKTCV